MNDSTVKISRNEIRLLRLRPRCYQHPQHSLERFHDVTLFCKLEVASRQLRASYTALSYAWGNGNGNRPICIGDTIVKVSITLEAALQELRDEQEDLMLWVDQLCINQEDEEEKGHQVKEMKNIYAHAAHVIAWIGVAADNSDLILAHLTSIGERAPKSTKALNKKSFQYLINRTFAGILPAIANPQTLEAVSIGFEQFCQRPYWRRLWVIQEYSVARKVEVVCGSVRISHLHLQRALDSIARLLYYLEDLAQEDSDDELVKLGYIIVKAYNTSFSSFLEGIVTRRHKYKSSKAIDNSLFHILISSLVLESDHNHPECSDPRDRVFAVLGLADDASSFDSFPDYSSTCEDVYTKATKQLLNQGHIDIFSYCHFPRDKSMPSWVPDWRTMTFGPIAYDPWRDEFAFMASGNTRQRPNITFTHPNLLSLSGTIIDTIEELGSPWNPNWLGSLDPQASLKYIYEIESFCAQSPRIDIEEEEMQTARIAIADWDRAGGPDVGIDVIAIDSYRRLRSSFAASSMPAGEGPIYDKDTWYRRAMQFLRPCRPFISSSGFVGLGPCDVEIGDVICIFLGGLVPYVLRQESDGIYSLIGEAYVHDIMYGEHMKDNPVITMIVLK
jgi:hypothetical protein